MQTLSVQLFDTATDEKYVLFDMPNVHGTFIGALREEVQRLVDNKSIFPAWHMNKKHWITIILDGSMPLDEIFKFIDRSYELAKKST